MSHRSSLGVTLTLVISCGHGAVAEAPAKQLCPGGDGLSLSIALKGGNLQTIETKFAEANGSLFMHVSKRCEFWVNSQSWFTKHGSLSAEQELELHDKLGFNELAAVTGTWGTAGCSDGSSLTIDADDAQSRCLCSCGSSSTPEAVARLSSSLTEWTEELAALGEDWIAPRRILVVEASWASSYSPVDWPAPYDLEEFLTATDNTGVLLSEGLNDELRRLQHEYDDGDGFISSRPANPLPVRANSNVYGVYFQDVLPF